jgi:hypothetical protein
MFNNKQTNFPMQSVSGFPQNQTNTQFPVPSGFPKTQSMSSFPQTQPVSSFPQTQPVSSFPQTQFQVPSGFPIATNTEYNIYSIVEKNFLNIKTLSIFTRSQDMKPSDLDIINNISTESIEKLGEQSIIYIKNNNNKTKLNNIFEKHLELITKIIKFNNIYSEISLNIKQLASLELTDDQKNFTFTDIFSRYKLQLYEIIGDIQMLIAYKSLITIQ